MKVTKRNKLLITIVIITLGLLAIFLSTKGKTVSVYPTKEDCELATVEECVFPVCGPIPKGATFKDVCNVDFNQGWITIRDFALYSDRLTTVFSSEENCELSTKKNCVFKDCSSELWNESCAGEYKKGWRPEL